jgi:hypothetical protein
MKQRNDRSDDNTFDIRQQVNQFDMCGIVAAFLLFTNSIR